MKPSLTKLTTIATLLGSHLFLTDAVAADVYAYHGANGERILTDKRIHDKSYRLVKVYKTRSKPKSVRKALTSQAARKKYAHQSKGSTRMLYQCANPSYMNQQRKIYKNIIRAYAAKYGVEEALIYSVVKQESCFNEKALSRAGAIGLMQLMPATASHLNIKDPWNPEQNIRGGVKYLSHMLKRFNGNTKFALAAYNAGPGKVERYGGIPPYRETRDYVKKIMADYERQKSMDL
ncbi:MAG: lytic transglycosylase [Proteobacteria bacterium]|nr:MAG: lytic transglycosylase [Pseudomonadota bacterium]